jgi:GT2 family glycosyltransferase
MKVSVLIHNFNRASILRYCLNSVAEQAYRPLEVIILDAGSTDESLSVISCCSHIMTERGIEVKMLNCPLLGVAASRNLAAQHASGELLCVIDNDATIASSASIERVVELFQSEPTLAVVTARIVTGDSDDIDPSTWVYRRSLKKWSEKQFKTFTFTGGGFCVRTEAFWSVGGFWDHLKFSREEEELALALVDKGWELFYVPEIVIRHYADPRGRSSIVPRRYVELRNGLLIYWRRLPLPLAVIASAIRICSASYKMIQREKTLPVELIQAVTKARKEWREANLERVPVSVRTVFKYFCLHFSR